MARDHDAARDRPLPAPGRHDVQRQLRRAGARLAPAHRARCWSTCSTRASTRTPARPRGRPGPRAADRGGDRRGREPRPGPHPAQLPRGDAARCCGRTTSSARPTARRSCTCRSSSTRRSSRGCRCRARASRSSSTRRSTEGVHLRGGKVARGGLRWSDRREDFRTEVLGLMKAQMVKNAVIVPVGAKGGFVVKRPPAADDRAAVLEEVERCYRTFIRGAARRHRQHRRRRDRAAAGRACATTRTTPTSSSPPTAARRRSPTSPTGSPRSTASGSATRSPRAARSATTTRRWASRRAARGSRSSATSASSATTSQSEDFTVVGIGDMSGDVFGNGMLLSPHIRLIGAFDHRHVFLDPNPDAARSFEERRRLFELPRSSWDDYDAVADLRGRRRLPAHGQVDPAVATRRAPRSTSRTSTMAPNDLIRALLQAPADLLWNGGIGTYVKASRRDARRRRRQGQRRRPRRRRRAAREGRRRGRQPRPDPARPHRVRARRRAHQHRRDRQLVRRRLLRPRGQHQDPARRGGGRRRPDRQAAQRAAGEHDRRGRRARPEGHLRADRDADAWPRPTPSSMLDVHARLIARLEQARGLDRKLETLPSRRGDRRAQARQPRPDAARAGDAAGLQQDRPVRAAARLRRARGPVPVARARGVLPGPAARALQPAHARPPAVARDHRDAGRQQRRARRRLDVRVPPVRGDRRERGGHRARLHGRARGLRDAPAVARDRGARQPGAGRGPDADAARRATAARARRRAGCCARGGGRWRSPTRSTSSSRARSALYDAVPRLLAEADAQPLARRADELREAGVPERARRRTSRASARCSATFDIVEVAFRDEPRRRARRRRALPARRPAAAALAARPHRRARARRPLGRARPRRAARRPLRPAPRDHPRGADERAAGRHAGRAREELDRRTTPGPSATCRRWPTCGWAARST